MLKPIPIAIAIAAASASGAPAAQPAETRTRTVSYGDLDLSGAAGRARLQKRIRNAARAVCGTPSPGDVHSYFEMRECRSQAYNAAWNRYAARVTVTAARDAGAAAGTR